MLKTLSAPRHFAPEHGTRFGLILGLLIWVSLEYENNLFLQSWAKSNVGPVSFLLNGTLAGLYAGAMLGYAVAEYAGRRSEEEKILESLKKKSLA